MLRVKRKRDVEFEVITSPKKILDLSSDSESENEEERDDEEERSHVTSEEEEMDETSDEDEDDLQLSKVAHHAEGAMSLEEQLRKEKLHQHFGPTPSFLQSAPKRSRTDSASSSESDSTYACPILASQSGSSTSQRLKAGILGAKHCPDGNRDLPSQKRLTTVRFHPRQEVLMTTSTDRTLAFFKVDGEDNDLLSSHMLQQFPIKCARFTRDGSQVVLTSRFPSFKVFDLGSNRCLHVPAMKGMDRSEKLERVELAPDGNMYVFMGKEGRLYFVDIRSREKIASSKISGTAESIAFSRDNMFVYGDEGTVCLYDMKGSRQKFRRQWCDEVGVGGLDIDVSPDEKWIACGSSSGIVNLYRWEDTWHSENPKPVKAFGNLTTGCDRVAFNHSGELLAFSSSDESKAVRMVHISSQTVYSDFPERSAKMGSPTDLHFSPASGFLSIGQSNGRAALYKLNSMKY